MTQAMEAPVLTGPCGLGLRQVLVEVMEEVQQSVEQDVGGAGLLHTLLSSAWLQALLQVFEGLHRFRRQSPTPALTYASGLSLQLQSDLSSVSGGSEEVQELNLLLRQPHLQALFWAHDSVAQKDYEPVLPPMPQEVPVDQEATRTVCLVKNKQPLGATIKRNDITGEIFVARVIYGGLAQRSGLLHAGDRILEVNGLPVDGMEPEQVIQTVQARSTGTIMFRVVPITERPVHSQTMLYLRALVDYSPQQDPSIPCADAGMGFQRGEVLEVVDQTDALWWQAQRLPPSGGCAGLVPSACLLRRKQREHWWSQPYQLHSCTQTLSTVEEEDMMADDKCVEADEDSSDSEELREEEGEFGSSSGLYIAGFRRSLRQCRRRSHSTTQPCCSARCPGSSALSSSALSSSALSSSALSSSALSSSALSSSAPSSPYEEVVRYQRGPGETHRLVALMGAPGVGVNELRRRLIASDPALYQGATPHTTRAPRRHEENGREYNFISRELFDNMVYNNRFLEYGEFQGSLYGTSIQAVKEVLTAGKTCVIDIEPNAIQAVRTPELKAFIVFIKPPSAERLRETRQEAVITSACSATRPFTDVDYRDLEEASRRMESHYSQFLDRVVLSEELGPSTALLRGAVQQAQDLPQWVPAAWIRPPEES